VLEGIRQLRLSLSDLLHALPSLYCSPALAEGSVSDRQQGGAFLLHCNGRRPQPGSASGRQQGRACLLQCRGWPVVVNALSSALAQMYHMINSVLLNKATACEVCKGSACVDTDQTG
jgi:hypothetical protein